MFEKLDHIEAKYQELTDALATPEIVSDSAKYQKTAKAHPEQAIENMQAVRACR